MIIEIVKEIAGRIKDPDEIRKRVLLSADPARPPAWNSLALADGYPGILLLMSTLDSLYPDEGWDQIAHAYVVKIKKLMEFGKNSNYSLIGGLTGICFAIQQASRNNTRYQKLHHQLQEFLFKGLKENYFIPIKEKFDLNLPLHPELYNLAFGICGIGMYALHNVAEPQALIQLRKILKICIHLTKKIKIGPYEVPGWYVSFQHQPNEEKKQRYPKGNFILGMYDGVCGILALLSIALLNEIEEEGQREAIQQIAAWIDSQKHEQQGNFYWPPLLEFEEVMMGKGENKLPDVNGWFGSPGIARTLYLAGKALGDLSIQQKGISAFLRLYQPLQIDRKTMTPSFGYGLASHLTLVHLMARDTQNTSLHAIREKLESELLQHYQASYPLGFRDREFSYPAHEMSPALEVDKVGLLEGVSGTLLALLSSQTKRLKWAAPFFIEGII